MIGMFGLFAEIERDLISQRTKEGLAYARASGKKLGRPMGSLGKSILDGKEAEIQMLLEKDVSKASIAKILGVSRSGLLHFIVSRSIQPNEQKVRSTSTVKGAKRGARRAGSVFKENYFVPTTGTSPQRRQPFVSNQVLARTIGGSRNAFAPTSKASFQPSNHGPDAYSSRMCVNTFVCR